jgi:hypothetical protein
MTPQECIDRYGAISNGLWDEESKWCALVEVQPELQQHVLNVATSRCLIHIYCNLDMKQAMLNSFQNIIDRGLMDQFKTFDGCFMIRDIRGIPGEMSAHSYALALDINAATNKLGTPGDISDEFAQCFTDEGFTWGKTFHRQDPMHFSWAGF